MCTKIHIKKADIANWRERERERGRERERDTETFLNGMI